MPVPCCSSVYGLSISAYCLYSSWLLANWLSTSVQSKVGGYFAWILVTVIFAKVNIAKAMSSKNKMPIVT